MNNSRYRFELTPEGEIKAVPVNTALASRASDHLTLSAAHRLLSSLAHQTQSRSELEECRDVMAKLERMVEEG